MTEPRIEGKTREGGFFRCNALLGRLKMHALPDPHDEREVMHAPLLREAANEIERLEKELIELRAKTFIEAAEHCEAHLYIANTDFGKGYVQALMGGAAAFREAASLALLTPNYN